MTRASLNTDPPHQAEAPAPEPTAPLQTPWQGIDQPSVRRRVKTMSLVGAVCGALAVLIGFLDAAGWLLDNETMLRLRPSFGVMPLLLACSVILLGIAVIVIGFSRARWTRPLVFGLVAPVLISMSLIAFSWVTGVRFDWLERLFGAQPEQVGDVANVRPSLMSATACLLLATGIAMTRTTFIRLGQTPLLMTSAIAVTPFIAYLMDAPALRSFANTGNMSLPSAAALSLLCIGAQCTESDRGLTGLSTSETLGGEVVRIFLPAAFAVPVALGWVISMLARSGHITLADAMTLIIGCTLVIPSAFSWWLANALRGVDLQRRGTEDVVERINQLIEERDHLAGELSRANEDLEAFAAIAAHDLRSPLVSIKGYAELLTDEPDLVGDAGRRWLERITHATDRGATLIEDLLAYSRSKQADGALDEVDLTALAREVVVTSERPEAVRVAAVGRMLGDESMLRQLLSNLIENAVRYSEELHDHPEVLVDSVSSPNTLTIRVMDNGPGIPEEDRERVLGMFERGRTQLPGSGIGLAICVRVAERHGGSLWIDESPRGGARVNVLLPLRPPKRTDIPRRDLPTLDES